MVRKDNPNIPYSLSNFPKDLSRVKFFATKEQSSEKIKAFVGWDGIVIFDKNLDVLQTLKMYAKQYQNYAQSCGRCTPGKFGGKVLYELLNKIQNDPHADTKDIDKLKEVCELMLITSKCEIGKTTPKPILQILESNPEVFTQAIQNKSQDVAKSSNDSKHGMEKEIIIPTSSNVIYSATRPFANDDVSRFYELSEAWQADKPNISELTSSKIQDESLNIGLKNTNLNHRKQNHNLDESLHQENEFELLQRYKSAIKTKIGDISYISKITAPCTDECPSRVDIPAYIEGVKDIRYMDSLSNTRGSMPLAQVCSRVCPHPCENACRRAMLDSPISIMELKRIGANAEFSLRNSGSLNKYATPNYIEKDEFFSSLASVGVIGAGPAGLSAAYYMALRGIKVDVYEALPVLGGEVAVGVPNYRMPIDAYNHDIDACRELGVVFHTNYKVDSKNILELEKKHLALVIAVGTRISKKLGCKNENLSLNGYWPAISFMDSVNLSQKFQIGELPNLSGKKIVCVGGGFTSMDVVRCCIRLGAESVIMLYRRDEETIIKNTSDEEYHEACEEGVAFQFLSTVDEIIEQDGAIKALKINRYELIKSESNPKGELKLIEDEEMILDCDILIPAVSQEMDFPLESSFGVETTKWKTILTDEASFSTTKNGIFAIGDCVSGPLTIVNAVGHGRRVASVIANYLKTGEVAINADEQMEDILKKIGVFDKNRDVHGFLSGNEREVSTKLAPFYRSKNFEEVNFGLSIDSALHEASRCMRCYYISMCVVGDDSSLSSDMLGNDNE